MSASPRRNPGKRPDPLPAELVALTAGRIVGVVHQTPVTAQLSFSYDETWRATDGAFPLSLSLPLTQSTYDDSAIRNFLGAVVPDRAETLARIEMEHRISRHDPFALLSVLGEDCPGAIQFARPKRVAALQSDDGGSVAWLTEADVAKRIRALRLPGAPDRLEGDKGYLSLPGQQPKSALIYDLARDRWGVPEGRQPTTHIIKPPLGADLRYLVAELVSLRLAEELGLAAAEVFVLRARDQTALAVVRYDRFWTGSRWVRVHQEDMCQALGLAPIRKFEQNGGPGIADVTQLLRTHSTEPDEDVWRFLKAIALNWVILGTDAHARNYSVLIGRSGNCRLAPLYDVTAMLGVVAPKDRHTLPLTMQVGGEYVADRIRREEWRNLAVSLAVHPAELEERIGEWIMHIPEAIAVVVADARARDALPATMLVDLEKQITRRAQRCAGQLGRHRKRLGISVQ